MNMPVCVLLERLHKLYGDEVALVELNPLMKDTRKTTWKEYDLVQQTSPVAYRREITWSVFDEKANRVANMLLGRGIKKGDRVAILMFNCLEWLPIYFGILKTGALAVPLNFRYAPDEIEYRAIRAYLQNGNVEKACAECESLGWDSAKIIAEIGIQRSQDGTYEDAGVPLLVNDE